MYELTDARPVLTLVANTGPEAMPLPDDDNEDTENDDD